MINQNNIRWEDFSREDQQDMLKLRDAIVEFEREIRVYEVNIFSAIVLKTTYTADIMDFFQFGTYPKVIDFKYETFGKEPTAEVYKWLDDFAILASGNDFSKLLEQNLNTGHLVELKAEVCDRIAKRNNIPVGIFSRNFFLDYEITELIPCDIID